MILQTEKVEKIKHQPRSEQKITNKREKEYYRLKNGIEAMWDYLKDEIEADGKNDYGYCGIMNYTRHCETIKLLRRWLNDLADIISSAEMKDK